MSWHPSRYGRGRGAVRWRLEGAVAEVVLDNPGARNALSPGMMADLEQAVLALEAYSGVGVVLRGEGSAAFCAGGDLEAVRAHLLEPGAGAGMAGFMGPLLDRLAALPLVVVAAVEGAALGGGAELLTCADHVVLGRGARVGFVQGALGVSPGWGGGRRLIARAGRHAALELLAGAPVLDAQRAATLGLAHQVVDDGQALAAAHAWLAPMLALPPQAVRGAVRVVKADTASEEQAIFAELWGAEAHRSALARLGRAGR